MTSINPVPILADIEGLTSTLKAKRQHMRSISQKSFETTMLRGVRGTHFRAALKRVLREHKGRLAFLLLDHYTVSIRINDLPHITAHYSNGLIELTGAPDDAFWCINHDRLTFADLVAYANP